MRIARIALLISVVATAGFAQNNRSAVSLTGNDAATCTVPDPCRTFDTAMSKTNSGGEVIVLSSAGYGPFTVTKSISIIAPPAYHAAMAPTSGSAITIAAGVTVVLRNLYLNSLGADIGIQMEASGSIVHVENLVINGFTLSGIKACCIFPATSEMFIKDTEIRGCGDGIYTYVSSGNLKVFVDHTRLEANSVNGMSVNQNSTVAANQSLAAGNGGNGFYVTLGKLTVSNSVASANETGFRAYGGQLAAHGCEASDNGNGFLTYAGGVMTVSNSLATRNIEGIVSLDGRAFISNNTVTDNGTGLHVTTGFMESLGNNMVRGNTTNINGSVTPVTGN